MRLLKMPEQLKVMQKEAATSNRPVPLKLIAGLGNPGSQYERTRHNAGADWVRAIAAKFQLPLSVDSRFKGEIARGTILGVDVRLVVPTTYMNLSGEAVGALARFFKIEPEEVLVAYDEMAFEPGIVKLRHGGGDNGHNGLKSVRGGLGSGDYHRLRIGVGHPGDKNRVTAYLTQIKQPQSEATLIHEALDWPDAWLGQVLAGDWQSAMNNIHAAQAQEKNSGI